MSVLQSKFYCEYRDPISQMGIKLPMKEGSLFCFALGKIWIQNVGEFDCKVISALKIQINSKNQVFGRKNQLRTW